MAKVKKGDRTLKSLTFTPLKNNRYRCNQNVKEPVVSKSQILSLIMAEHHNGPPGQVLKIKMAPKKKRPRGPNHRTLADQKRR